MKNIIICGLIGTGKTTLAKKVSQNLNYNYIDLNKKVNTDTFESDKEFLSKKLRQQIDNYIYKLKNSVIDCEYLILPNDYSNYLSKDICDIIYLGFYDVDINILYDKFVQDYKSKGKKYDETDLLNQLKYFKKISEKIYNDCKKYGYKFFDISKDKSIVLEEIYSYIETLHAKNNLLQ